MQKRKVGGRRHGICSILVRFCGASGTNDIAADQEYGRYYFVTGVMIDKPIPE
jgi:hypothetical protein